MQRDCQTAVINVPPELGRRGRPEAHLGAGPDLPIGPGERGLPLSQPPVGIDLLGPAPQHEGHLLDDDPAHQVGQVRLIRGP